MTGPLRAQSQHICLSVSRYEFVLELSASYSEAYEELLSLKNMDVDTNFCFLF